MRPIALLAVLPVAIVCAAPASASYPGRDGELAAVWNQFDRGGDSDFELRLVTPTGTVLRRVAACSRPEPSYEPPSGECPARPGLLVAGRPAGLRARRAAGRGRRRRLRRDRAPAADRPRQRARVSPGGSRLVFTGVRSGRRNLYVVNPDGTNLRQLTRGRGRAPNWSVRQQIAYVSAYRIYRLDPRATRPRRVLLARGDNLNWSTTGLSVAYQRPGDLYRVPARAGSRRVLLVRRGFKPIYSPNGRQLAFLRYASQNLGSSLWIANRNGTGERVALEGGEQPVGSTWVAYDDPAWRPLP
jgi:WD40-like Beta Propeller Repeat